MPFDKTANITIFFNVDYKNHNTKLLEICYKDWIQKEGAWQGSQLARGATWASLQAFQAEAAQRMRKKTTKRMIRCPKMPPGSLILALASQPQLNSHL